MRSVLLLVLVMLLLPLLLLPALLPVSTPVCASEGDCAPWYQACVVSCLHVEEERMRKATSPWFVCGSEEGIHDPHLRAVRERWRDRSVTLPPASSSSSTSTSSSTSLSTISLDTFAMRLMQWDCPANCKYLCMHALERERERERTIYFPRSPPFPPLKYFGKWPFVRVLGMQEPASVFFSIVNLLPHAYYLPRFVRTTAAHAHVYPLRNWWVILGAVNLVIWIWSAVFHARDTLLTERLDYYTGFVGVALGTLVSALRLMFWMHHERRPRIVDPAATTTTATTTTATASTTSATTWSTLASMAARGYRRLASSLTCCRCDRPHTRRTSQFVLVCGVSLLIFAHLSYLTFVQMDYGFNMRVNMTLGAIQLLVQLTIVACLWSRSYARNLLYSCLAFVLSIGLVALDFPPWYGLFDSHALWHAATPPISFFFWRFIVADTEHVVIALQHDERSGSFSSSSSTGSSSANDRNERRERNGLNGLHHDSNVGDADGDGGEDDGNSDGVVMTPRRERSSSSSSTNGHEYAKLASPIASSAPAGVIERNKAKPE